jgi:NAD(P)-dependent dehydrogenase (short-subunit alcohol dehydrogenase family)
MLDFTGKTVFITGGGSGLGYACAEKYLALGAKVAVADISREVVDAACEQLNGGDSCIGLVCNVTSSEDIDAAVATVVARWGKLDIGVNNAGISSPLTPLGEASEADFDKVMAVNLKGVWLSMRCELEQMTKQGFGSIVNMASALSLRVFAGGGFYVASKFAVAGLTRTAAIEYATQGIRINAVCPGNVATPLVIGSVDAEMLKQLGSIHPMQRLGEPEEIAAAVVWMSSDSASFNTGNIFPVDGGWSAQ